jgi:glycosyltransferase involved in cell wall biosynthesis
MVSNDDKLENSTVIIPLHLPLEYPCDYIDQTAKILSKNNSVVLFDYFRPYSWKEMLNINNLKDFVNSCFNIFRSKRVIYFRSPSILPFTSSKKISNLNKKLGFFVLSFILRLLDKNTVLWQFSTLIKAKVFKKQFFLYDCVDYKNSVDATKKYLAEESEIFKISDLVSFNSEGLFNNKRGSNPILTGKSVVTVCGCNCQLFFTKTNKITHDFAKISQKKIVFMGVFDHRVDTKLLKYVVGDNRNKKFIFIGPIRKSVPKSFSNILKEKNVLYLGEKTKNELPDYLKKCDLGIIPYNAKTKLVRYSNPMKAYEYLACGLPIVSTNILTLNDLHKDIVYTTDDQIKFSHAIKRTIIDWNTKKSLIAKNIAEKNSWERKISIIKNHIAKNEKAN